MKREMTVAAFDRGLSKDEEEPLSLESLVDVQKDLGKGRIRQSPKLEGVVIGTLMGFDGLGRPQVEFPGSDQGALSTALSTLALDQKVVGRAVVLQFEDGDRSKPVILGLVQQPPTPQATGQKQIDVVVDGERLVFTAETEIVLRCGKASITLTRAGKVLIRGAYLLNRSSGVNRIKGGSVQIN
jgi:hypothetical protein